MKKLNIVILEGTKREKRKSIFAARLIEKVGQEIDEIEVKLIDPKDFKFEGDGNDDPEGKNPEYTKLTQWADAFFIVTPEYNHSFPGTLKRMLDSELSNYIHKPVAFAGVSSGMIGGARAIEALAMSVREMGMVTTFTDVHFPKIQDMFDDNGSLKEEKQIERVKRTYTELIWMAKTLKYGRENVPSRFHEK